MYRHYVYFALYTVTGLFWLCPVLAETQPGTQSAITSDASLDFQIDRHGYIQHIQVKDIAYLMYELGATYRDCQRYRVELVVMIDDLQINTGDYLITAILPGGLLYYAQKKVRLQSAQTKLSSIDQVLADLATDLAFLGNDGRLARSAY